MKSLKKPFTFFLFLFLLYPVSLLLASGRGPGDRFFRLSAGAAIANGPHLQHVYSSGIHLQTSFYVPLYRELHFSPALGLDYYGKNINQSTYDRLVNVFTGAGLNWSLPLFKEQEIFFTPAVSCFYGYVKDNLGPRSGYRGDTFSIISGKGAGFSLESTISFNRLEIGCSYLIFKPEVNYSKDLMAEITKHNRIHDIFTVSEDKAIYNLSSVRLFFGYSF